MTEGTDRTGPEQKYIVRIGDGEEHYTSRTEALAYAKEQSREVRGPVIVDSEAERSSYRYVAGELAQFVTEMRR